MTIDYHYNYQLKQFFYSELSSGVGNKGGQRKRYKDTLKQTLKLTGINAETWHELAEDRTVAESSKEGSTVIRG